MYDMSRVNARGYNDSMTPEQRAEALNRMSRQRWADFEAGAPALAGGVPDDLASITDPAFRRYHEYYKTQRGFHERSPNSMTGWTVTNSLSFMNMPLLTYITEISPRPMLLIAGENAHSRYFSEEIGRASCRERVL